MWDALVKRTGVELELLSELEKYNFIEAGVREPPADMQTDNNVYLKIYARQKKIYKLCYVPGHRPIPI